MPRATRWARRHYLTQEQVEAMSSKDRILEIDHCAVEYIAREERLVLYFVNVEEPWPLNPTNVESLIEIFGTDETDEWHGQRIEVYRDPSIMMGDRRVGGIRARKAR